MAPRLAPQHSSLGLLSCTEGAWHNGSSCNSGSLPVSVYDLSASQDIRLGCVGPWDKAGGVTAPSSPKLEGHTHSRVSAGGMLNIPPS